MFLQNRNCSGMNARARLERNSVSLLYFCNVCIKVLLAFIVCGELVMSSNDGREKRG